MQFSTVLPDWGYFWFRFQPLFSKRKIRPSKLVKLYNRNYCIIIVVAIWIKKFPNLATLSESIKMANVTIHFLFATIYRSTQILVASIFTNMWIMSILKSFNRNKNINRASKIYYKQSVNSSFIHIWKYRKQN